MSGTHHFLRFILSQYMQAVHKYIELLKEEMGKSLIVSSQSQSVLLKLC